MAAICTYNARILAFESSTEELLMQARMIRCDVINLAETRRRHRFKAVYYLGEELSVEYATVKELEESAFSSTRISP
uniref:Myosin motor domain-containing protein n=1 Tax=Angiostrongylus cantonensis TaxID=6313 RepID=A0A0K0DBW8_ANGCA